MKKILSIVALCLIAVIAGTIIVFSCVDKDYNLKTAFEPMKNYINRISKHCKEIILN